MNQYALDMYRQMFLTMRRGHANGEPSKAKPVFILSLIEFIPLISQNLIQISDPILIDYYTTNLELYTGKKTPSLPVPFFHMDSEPFYEILWKSSDRPKNYPHTQSAKSILQFAQGAKLDDELWELLQDAGNREYLKNVIIETYLS